MLWVRISVRSHKQIHPLLLKAQSYLHFGQNLVAKSIHFSWKLTQIFHIEFSLTRKFAKNVKIEPQMRLILFHTSSSLSKPGPCITHITTWRLRCVTLVATNVASSLKPRADKLHTDRLFFIFKLSVFSPDRC